MRDRRSTFGVSACIAAGAMVLALACANSSNDGGGNAATPGADAGIEAQAATACSRGNALCGGACVSLLSDPKNCGACNVACATDEVCGGRCGKACPLGTLTCGQSCSDPRTDPDNCGRCGTKCAEGLACVSGRCGCAVNQIRCGDTCVDARTDVQNCGACGNVCGGGFVCASGSCTACRPGQITCQVPVGPVDPVPSMRCADPQTSPTDCGGCGQACGVEQVCVNGSCGCGPLLTSCDGDGGTCVDTKFDPNHCGNCSTRCDGGACVNGACN